MVTKLLKADDVASIMDVSKSFVYKLIRTGELPAVRLGSAVRVKPDDLEDFIKSCTGTDLKPISISLLKDVKNQ